MKPPRAFLLLLFFLTCPLALALALAAPSCPVQPADRPPANEAEAAMRRGEDQQAAKLYAELLTKSPGDPALTANLVRLDLESGDTAAATAALADARAAHPQSAAVLAAQGLLDYRAGDMAAADQDFFNARKADPCYAQAYVGSARIARLRAMYGVQQTLLKTAHQLDAADPVVSRAWHGQLTPAERLQEARNALGQDAKLSPEQRRNNEAYIAHMEEAQAHPCTLADAVETANLPLERMMDGPDQTAGWGLTTAIGGKSALLLLDSGASGVYVSRSFATSAGLKPVEKSTEEGIGSHGIQTGYRAYADEIRVGSLAFHNCIVDVSDRRDVAGANGLIGTDVFRDFLITLDYPGRQFRLAPLPGPRSGTGALDTADTDTPALNDNATAHNAYDGPELKGYTQVYRIGSKVLVPTRIEKKGPFLLLLDTGAGVLAITEQTSKTIGAHPTRDNATVFGVSGNVSKVDSIGHAQLQFGNANTGVDGMLVFDTPSLDRYTGTTVAGFLGGPILQRLTVTLDYRDNMVRFDYDAKRDEQLNHTLNPFSRRPDLGLPR